MEDAESNISSGLRLEGPACQMVYVATWVYKHVAIKAMPLKPSRQTYSTPFSRSPWQKASWRSNPFFLRTMSKYKFRHLKHTFEICWLKHIFPLQLCGYRHIKQIDS